MLQKADRKRKFKKTWTLYIIAFIPFHFLLTWVSHDIQNKNFETKCDAFAKQ